MFFYLKSIWGLIKLILRALRYFKKDVQILVIRIHNSFNKHCFPRFVSQGTYDGGSFQLEKPKESNVGMLQQFLLREYIFFKLFGQREQDIWDKYFAQLWGRNFHNIEEGANQVRGTGELEILQLELQLLVLQITSIANYYGQNFYLMKCSPDLLCSTSLPRYNGIKESIVTINQKICKLVKYINHWKFLRDELHLVLCQKKNNLSVINSYSSCLGGVKSFYGDYEFITIGCRKNIFGDEFFKGKDKALIH